MNEEAFLLAPDDRGVTENLIDLLRFFGIGYRQLTLDEFLPVNGHAGSSKARVICSAERFAEIAERLEAHPRAGRWWQERVHSVFIYATADVSLLQSLLRRLTGDEAATATNLSKEDRDFCVSDMTDLCGPMSGLRVTVSELAGNDSVMRGSPSRVAGIITNNYGAVFLKLGWNNRPLFLSGVPTIVDLATKLSTGIFDIRDHFLTAAPIVFYLKWAFPTTCWKSPEVNACLIIDDPLLKPRHGFVDFGEILSLMKQHRFCTNIAFIPWNWRRSDRQVARMIAENPEYYSLSVHGCDHTHAEFGTSDIRRLSGKVNRALQRMDGHQCRTGIAHKLVMVFPQGIFSDAAMNVLKRSELMGAINNDTISIDSESRSITIADVWDIAVMSYHSFPLFTRRYPSQGIENFAFDITLGKPAIIVIHHDYCSDHYDRLLTLIDRLNSLNPPPIWRDPGEIVRRSYRSRQLSAGVVEVEMYSRELRLANDSGSGIQFNLRKRECDVSAVEKITAGSRQLTWRAELGLVQFELDLQPAESTIVSVQLGKPDASACARYREPLFYEAKTMLRRYYCELRDNYLTKWQLSMRSSYNGDA